MRNFLLIVKREFITKVKSKSYLILLFLSPLLMLGMFMAVFYFVSNDDAKVSKDTKAVLVTGDRVSLKLKDCTVDYQASFNKEDLAKIMKEGVYSLAIYTNFSKKDIQIYSPKKSKLRRKVQEQLKIQWQQYVLQLNGVDASVIAKVYEQPKVEHIYTKESKNEIVKWVKNIISIGIGYLVMMFVIIYGNSVMRSIIEEKNSRVIEIMICTVKPIYLMMGKIIGNTLAGILQFFTWAILLGIGLGALEMSSATQGNAIVVSDFIKAIQEINIISVLSGFMLFFVMGYLLYSSIYASVGAAVNSETDTQQFVHPILLPLMFAVYIGAATVVNGNPHGHTATLFSMIPLTSPVVMPMRIPFGVPLWEIFVSLALLLVSFALLITLAAKIYRIGILSYGNKPSIKQMIKWLKY